MPDLADLLDEGSAALERLLTDAYEAGRAYGRQEGVAEFQDKLAAFLRSDVGPLFKAESRTEPSILGSAVQEAPSPAPLGNGSTSWMEADARLRADARAAPNSVKPTILKLVREQPGLNKDQIAERTGFKFNSVRGTLWTLGNEKVIEQRGGRWFPVAQTEEAADAMSGRDTSAASVTGVEDDASDQPEAQGREAESGKVEHEKIAL